MTSNKQETIVHILVTIASLFILIVIGEMIIQHIIHRAYLPIYIIGGIIILIILVTLFIPSPTYYIWYIQKNGFVYNVGSYSKDEAKRLAKFDLEHDNDNKYHKIFIKKTLSSHEHFKYLTKLERKYAYLGYH